MARFFTQGEVVSLSTARTILLNSASHSPSLVAVAIVTITCSRYATRRDLELIK